MQRLHLDLSWFTPYDGDIGHLYGIRDWVTSLNGTTAPLNTPRAGVFAHGTWHEPFSNCAHVAHGTAGTWEPLTTPLNNMCSCLNTDLFPVPGKSRKQRQPCAEMCEREQIDILSRFHAELDDDSTFDVTDRDLDRFLLHLARFSAQGRLLFPQLTDTLDAAIAATASRRDAHLVVSVTNRTHILKSVLAFQAGELALHEPYNTWAAQLTAYGEYRQQAVNAFAAPDVHLQADYLEGHVTLDELSRRDIDQRYQWHWTAVWDDLAGTPGYALEAEVRSRLVELRRLFLDIHFAELCELRDAVTGRTALMRRANSIPHLSMIGTHVSVTETARGRCGDELHVVPLAVVAATYPHSVETLLTTSSGATGRHFIELPAGTTVDDTTVRTVAAIDGNRQIPLPDVWECAHTLVTATLRQEQADSVTTAAL
jgi:hypothetical protein